MNSMVKISLQYAKVNILPIEPICILYSDNTLVKGMHSTILPPAMRKK